jgi:hypothetical protein
VDGRDRARLQRLRGTRWDEADARWVIGLAEAEGAALHHLAREHGLDPQRLYWWRRRLASATVAAEAGFVAVHVVEGDEVHEQAPDCGDGVVVETPAGHRIHVGPGFDADTLARVVSVLGGRC